MDGEGLMGKGGREWRGRGMKTGRKKEMGR